MQFPLLEKYTMKANHYNVFLVDWTMSKYKPDKVPELQLKHLENIVHYSRSKSNGVITLEVNHTDFQLKEMNP